MNFKKLIKHEDNIESLIEGIKRLGCEELESGEGTIGADIIIKNNSHRLFAGKRYFKLKEKPTLKTGLSKKENGGNHNGM